MTALKDYAYLQELPAHLKDYGLQAYQRIREDYKDYYYSTIVQGRRDYGNKCSHLHLYTPLKHKVCRGIHRKIQE